MSSTHNKKYRRVGLGESLSWTFGIIFIISGSLSLIDSIIGGLLVILAGLVILPPVLKSIRKKFNIEISKWLSSIASILMFFIGISLMPSYYTADDYTSDQSQNESTGKTITQMTTESADTKMTAAEIKRSSITLSYNELLRNRESYIGEIVHFRGEVFQYQESYRSDNVLIFTEYDDYIGYYDDIVWINYVPGMRLLEDDIIDVWGEFKGAKSYETVLGAENTVPEIDALLVEIYQEAN